MSLLISFFITLVLTPFMKILAKKLGIVDIPNYRKVHSTPIPLLGGVSIFLGFITCLVLCIPMGNKTLIILITSIMIMVMGLYDDISNLKASWRLAIEVLVAIIFIFFDIKIMVGSYITQNLTYIFLIDGIVTLLWIVGVINAINFIDGLDSLSVNITFWAAIGFLLLGISESNIVIIGMSLSLIGAILGFFPYNNYPARIFMGDAGSTFLGFILSILSILAYKQLQHPFAISIPILFLGVPLFDMLYVIFIRINDKKSILIADKSHIHHRLMEKGLGQKLTLLHINFFSLTSALIGYIIYLLRAYAAGMIMVVLFAILIIVKSGVLFGVMHNAKK